MPFLKKNFESCGKSVYVGENCDISYTNTSIGNNSSIGNNACLMSTRAKIKIGDYVMFGPNVSIITGNHRIDVVGRYMKDIKEFEKLKSNDEDVVINDDVWIGANAIILKGVTINEGSVIGAGSVVTKDVEAYSIYAGVPAKKVGLRFTEEEVLLHKRLLNQ